MAEETKGSGRGFKSHPENINKGGRPKGSRNKSSLMKAQLQLDSDSETAAEVLRAIMANDKDTLGLKDDIPVTLRMGAAKEILNKAIANEKDKVGEQSKDSSSSEEDNSAPIFSPQAVG